VLRASCEDRLDRTPGVVVQRGDGEPLEHRREPCERARPVDEVCLHCDEGGRADLVDERAEGAGEERLGALAVVCSSDGGLGVLEHEHGCGAGVGEGRYEASVERQQMIARSCLALSLAELILAREDERLRAARLARDGGWSLAQAASVLGMFDAKGWTVKRGPARGPGAYRELLDMGGLLSEWSVAVGQETRATRIAHRATRDVMAMLRGELREALEENVSWAVSGWAGLELSAPFTTILPSIHVYVAEDDFAAPLTAAIAAGGLREVDEGGRVTFWRADPRILALAEHREGIPVVSAPRLYADLASFDARGQDAADHIKALLIDPLHPKTAGERTPELAA